MKIYDLDRGARAGALAAPILCATLVVLYIGSGGSYLIFPIFVTAGATLVAWMLRANLRTWAEVTVTGVTWFTPRKASVHYSPSGSVPADRIAAIAVETVKWTPSTPKGLANGSKLVVVLHLLDGGRVVLPIASGREAATASIHRLVDALSALPGVPPIDASPLAVLPRANNRR